jgi:hypothetical protein
VQDQVAGRNIAKEVSVSAGSNAYNSLWQVRNDAWSTLEESTTQLALAGARELETQLADMSPAERTAHESAVLRLTAPSAPLPDFSGFTPEVHGYRADLGYRVYVGKALEIAATTRPAPPPDPPAPGAAAPDAVPDAPQGESDHVHR